MNPDTDISAGPSVIAQSKMADNSRRTALASEGRSSVSAQSPVTAGGKAIPAHQVKGKSVRGGLVTLSTQALTFLVQTGSTMVLARLLSPKDFGLQGMVVAVTGVLALFRDVGLGAATIQRDEITHEQLSTVFWINIAIGTVLMVLGVALAPALVAFYKEPRLFWIAVATASSFLLSGVANQHGAILMREMRFVTMAKIAIASLILSTAIGISMAAFGCGYWSLVVMALSASAITSIGYWVAVPWRPGRPRRRCGVRSMLHFGGTLTLNGLVIYLGYNAEKVLLGRFWGADVLGIYGRAYSLINLPMQQLHSSINAVAFPALSRIQREPERLCSSFLKAYSVLLSLSIPATLCCLLFADEVIPVVLGPKWAAAIPILQLLGPTVLALGFINPFGQFLNATGRVGRSLKIALLIAPLVIIGIAIGIPYGASGVALGYSTVMMCLVLPVITWATHGSGITLGSVFRAARPPILAGVVAGLAGFAFEVAFTEVMPLLPRVIIELGLVGGLYIWMLLIVLGQKELYADLVRHLLQRDRPNP